METNSAGLWSSARSSGCLFQSQIHVVILRQKRMRNRHSPVVFATIVHAEGETEVQSHFNTFR